MPIISLYFGNKSCTLSLLIRVNFIQILYIRVLLPVDKMFDVSHKAYQDRKPLPIICLYFERGTLRVDSFFVHIEGLIAIFVCILSINSWRVV